MSSLAFVHIKAADTTIMGSHSCIAIWLSKIEDQKSLMLHWRSFLEWGNDRFALLFAYDDDQYSIFGRMWVLTPLIAACLRIKIIDTLLTVTVITYQQSMDAQKLYSKCIHSLLTDNRLCVCIIMYTKSFEVSKFLSQPYTWYPNNNGYRPLAFWRFWLAIYSI